VEVGVHDVAFQRRDVPGRRPPRVRDDVQPDAEGANVVVPRGRADLRNDDLERIAARDEARGDGLERRDEPAALHAAVRGGPDDTHATNRLPAAGDLKTGE
jgi:hypothetical protein